MCDNSKKLSDGRLFNQTPLRQAVLNSSPEAVEILLKHGADANARDGLDQTPLHYATGISENSQNRKMFELLLAHKADPNVRNRNGQTPLDELKKFPVQNSANGLPVPVSAEQTKLARDLADLLRQHGALDNLPNWDRIAVSRPSANYSTEIFRKGTNDWNHFTLLELLWRTYDSNNKSQLSFSDLSRVVVLRPDASGTKTKQIEVNLLNATNSLDYTKDMPLEFGDVVEIPERGHTLAEKDIWTGEQMQKLAGHFREQAGDVRLAAGGQAVQVPLKDFVPVYAYLGNALKSSVAQNVLTSGSDLSRVKVTRHDLKTKKTDEWILDCSQMNPANGYPYFNCPDLLLRDGDVIAVPEKR